MSVGRKKKKIKDQVEDDNESMLMIMTLTNKDLIFFFFFFFGSITKKRKKVGFSFAVFLIKGKSFLKVLNPMLCNQSCFATSSLIILLD